VRVVLLALSAGALVAGCASASPGTGPADLAPAAGPGFDLASAPHDFAPHDLAGSGDLNAPADLAPMDAAPVACSSCTLTLVGGTIAAMKPGGGSWDAGGGLADAYVNLTLGGTTKRSSTHSDVTTVTWNETMFTGLSQAQLLAGFSVTVMDEDPLNPDDTVASWTVSPTTAQLAAGSITLTSGTGAGMVTTITLSIH
jgi:hypothetical protein